MNAVGATGGSTRSLPSRECGLKSIRDFSMQGKTESLPSRECGLKYI